MTKKIMSSAVLAGILVSGANAIEVTPFGQVGIIGNIGFGDGNTVGNSTVSGYLGVSGHVGLDLNISGFKIGAGLMAGYAPLTFGTNGSFANNAFVGRHGALYSRPWVELSDLYLGFQGAGLDFAIGRYNASRILATADWIGGHNQGFALSYQSPYFGLWATWVNDWLQTGYNASASLKGDGRYGMDLSGVGRFSSDWDDFNIRNELFALGLDFKIGSYVSISPYAQYWLRDWTSDVLQVGGRVILDFDWGAVKSTTTGRFLWSHLTDTGINGFMWQADQEFLFFNLLKIGGGYLSIGNVGLNSTTLVDRTRFYGQYLYPYGYNGVGLANRGYLNGGVDTWYVFAGLKYNDMLDFDVLYADGDYKEFSAIINYNILQYGNLKWSVGGGYVTNGFSNAHSGIAFTKLKF